MPPSSAPPPPRASATAAALSGRDRAAAGNRINPRKLLNSKWTATPPLERQKHFVVVKVEFDEEGLAVQECVIEAVLTRRRRSIDWQELKDDSRWRFGWK